MTEQEGTDLALRLLSTVTGIDPANLRELLEQAGEEWPYDSIILAELLVLVEQELGIEVPMDTSTARALRSVKGMLRRALEVDAMVHTA